MVTVPERGAVFVDWATTTLTMPEPVIDVAVLVVIQADSERAPQLHRAPVETDTDAVPPAIPTVMDVGEIV
jgi:hypothetical protein